MRCIAVINQKGGVGKTTTAANLGAALARLGRRVLVCDLDPQCNLTVHLDVDPAGEAPSLYELLRGEASLAQVLRPCRQPGLELLPSSVDLAGIELELVNVVGREVLLRDAFEADERAHGAPRWDFVLCDCPPSLGLLSLNALVLCDEIFVPVQAEFFALQGLSKLLEITQLVQRRLNPRLRVSALVSCRHDVSTNLGRQVMDDIRRHFGDVLCRTVIRRNVKLAEAPSHGRTIFEYDPECRGAEDYLALAREVLGLPAEEPARKARGPRGFARSAAGGPPPAAVATAAASAGAGPASPKVPQAAPTTPPAKPRATAGVAAEAPSAVDAPRPAPAPVPVRAEPTTPASQAPRPRQPVRSSTPARDAAAVAAAGTNGASRPATRPSSKPAVPRPDAPSASTSRPVDRAVDARAAAGPPAQAPRSPAKAAVPAKPRAQPPAAKSGAATSPVVPAPAQRPAGAKPGVSMAPQPAGPAAGAPVPAGRNGHASRPTEAAAGASARTPSVAPTRTPTGSPQAAPRAPAPPATPPGAGKTAAEVPPAAPAPKPTPAAAAPAPPAPRPRRRPIRPDDDPLSLDP